MKIYIYFIVAISFFSVNCYEKCKLSRIIKDAKTNNVTSVEEACKSKPCVMKCCDIDHYLYSNKTSGVRECLHKDNFQLYMKVSQVKFDFSDYTIYKSVEQRTDKDFLRDYVVLVNKDFQQKFCRQPISDKFRMFEDGRLGIYTRDNDTNFRNPLEFCVEKYIYKSKTGTRMKYKLFELIDAQDDKYEHLILVFTGVALLISAFFMILVLLVYSILKQLRNIQGMILMGYVATYTINYVLKAVTILGLTYDKFGSAICRYLSPFSYGFILSSFFWMNILSFDIWWTFRATRKIRSIHRQGELMKFMWYGLYAWGAPAAIAIAAYCIDNAEQINLIKPHFELCFQLGKNSELSNKLYLYLPMLIMTIINTLLLLMTIYNLWLIKRAIGNYDAPSQGKIKMNRNRFWLYIKVSLLMGVSWIVELVQLSYDPNNQLPWWSYIPINSPNLFIGLAIFFVFVFKKSILANLSKKCKINIKSFSTGRSTEYSGSTKSKTKSTKDEMVES